MKMSILAFFSILICLSFAACAEKNSKAQVSVQSSQVQQSDTQNDVDSTESQSISLQEQKPSTQNTEMSENEERKLKLIIAGQELNVTLYDTPTADALYDMLPIELSFEDFNGVEKIAYMDNDLPTEGEPDGCDPDVGDFCLYAPWGNLSIFYNDFRYSNSLIKLGHLDSGMDIIRNIQEDFSATLEKAE